ncbi:LysR family transcriptional regulator [Neptuniibacter sp. CAU 1671]|uniref:LysR family transcriptional regulator n=1 Tax=Neptuniibacter sp. CAU 1671 TaxID=3032593 RepID=UPI0023DA8462|nr:LysR family transcriptional regulator [Neptuniibacter sp. CAU 1671]MDF2180603.1 LysR family transcriptional regulator [Neptuniibacter sp. CAU 1671]
MNYQDLYLFIRIMDRGSFSAAADSLGMPPSTLSRRMQQFEESLGVKLLHRNPRHIALTEAGEKFYARCQPLFDELDTSLQSIEGELSSPTGLLKITAPVALATELLDDWFFEFMQQYPGIRLQLILNNRNIDLLEEGIDLAFRIGDITLQDWVRRPLFTSQFHLCASPTFIERFGLPEHPGELERFPLIVTARSPQWQFRDAEGNLVQLTPQGHLHVDELRTAANAVLQGIGLGNLPRYVIKQHLSSGELISVMPDWKPLGREVQMLYPHRTYMPLKVKLLVEFIMEKTRSLKL